MANAIGPESRRERLVGTLAGRSAWGDKVGELISAPKRALMIPQGRAKLSGAGMAQVVETHIRRRGVFGWIFLALFWAFNALMALWAWMALSAIHGQYVAAASSAYRAGTEAGGAIVGSVILFVWAAGAVILGLLALLTRGHKTVVIRSAA